jgi:asparagine synthase (glutamine-hydrolysing)
LFSAALARTLDGYDPGARIAALMDTGDDADPLRQAQRVDLLTYLPGDILTKVDRTSMATSLEVRAPLLDHDLVDWGLELPARLKRRDGTGKYILKRAMADLLPHEILYRGKQGFAASLAATLRERADVLRERLLGAAMQQSGLFDTNAISRLIDQHLARHYDHSGALWLLLVFEGFLALHQQSEPDSPRLVYGDAAGTAAMGEPVKAAVTFSTVN